MQTEESQAEGVDEGAQSQINLQYDWYQNLSHVFVAYKIRRGGEEMADGGLIVNFTETTMVLENS